MLRAGFRAAQFVTAIVLVFGFISIESVLADRSCRKALADFKAASHHHDYLLQLNLASTKWIPLDAPAMSFASHLRVPWLWMLSEEGSRYFTVKRNDFGQLLGPARVHSFRLPANEKLFPQAIEVQAKGDGALIAFRHEARVKTLILQRALLKDIESGELIFAKEEPLSFRYQGAPNELKIRSRHFAEDYWIADGSTTLTLITGYEEGLQKVAEIDLSGSLATEEGAEPIEALEDVIFFSEGTAGALVIRTETGRRYLIPFEIGATAAQVIDEENRGAHTSISIEFEKMQLLEERLVAVRAHPTEDVLLAIYSDHLRVIEFDKKKRLFAAHPNEIAIRVPAFHEIQDVHLFWDGEIRAVEASEENASSPQEIFVGDAFAAVVLKRLDTEKHYLVWAELGH